MDGSAIAVLRQTVIMFIIVVIGALCYKFKLINDEGRRQLSNLVLTVVNPLLIFLSYQTEMRQDLLEGFVWAAVMALITYTVFIILSHIFFRDKDPGNSTIERFSVIYSNCGFMGTPLIFGVFGADGVFIQTGFFTVFNLFVWTHGIMSISGERNKKTVLNALRSPALLSIAAGLICFFLHITLPDIVFTALNNVAEMTTPLAMIVAGASIMSAGLLKSVKHLRVYLVSAVKLIVFPVIGFLLIIFLPCSDMTKLISLIEFSCPAATIGTMFAIRFNKNSEYASQIFAVSTVLSAVTLPVITMLGTTVLEMI